CGSTLGNSAELIKSLPFPVLSQWGMEISFTYNESITKYYFRLRLSFAFDIYETTLVLTPATTTLAYLDVAGNEVAIDTAIHLIPQNYHFNIVKVVFDNVNKKYVRAILNETEYPLVDIDAYTFLTGTEEYVMEGWVKVEGEAGDNEVVYLDEFILTQNEP
ncbi:hypothetical protein LCGC14_1322930, partial [marine sediment metagenome]